MSARELSESFMDYLGDKEGVDRVSRIGVGNPFHDTTGRFGPCSSFRPLPLKNQATLLRLAGSAM
jgi:hypothetical protein